MLMVKLCYLWEEAVHDPAGEGDGEGGCEQGEEPRASEQVRVDCLWKKKHTKDLKTREHTAGVTEWDCGVSDASKLAKQSVGRDRL